METSEIQIEVKKGLFGGKGNTTRAAIEYLLIEIEQAKKHQLKVAKTITRYEKALIDIASFDEGDDPHCMDEPGSAFVAREALGKRLCKALRRLV